VLALPTKTPLQAVYSWHSGLVNEIDKLVEGNFQEQYDVIHIEHLRGVRYGLHVKIRKLKVPVVWDSVDCISYLFAQASGQSRSLFGKLITQFELDRTRRYEGHLPGQFDHVLITSPVDRQALLDLVPKSLPIAPISILPNGVDLEYFRAGEEVIREPALVILSGKMSYHANVTMALFLAQEVMPLIWQRRQDVQLTIVGKDPPGNILALGDHPAITVTGTVDDIRPYLRRATVAAVPLIYGAGSQFKLLEAMAIGTPVVATPRAVTALEVRSGQDLLIADGAHDFATKILEVIEDPCHQRQLGEAGRQFVERQHGWGTIVEKLEGIYNEVIHSQPKISGYRGGAGTADST
jgi:glycosyltransferase involved in cell wall biosynthesis